MLTNLPWRGIFVVFGAFLVHLTLGSLYTDGNLGPYVISYMRENGDPTITSASIVWITAIQMGVESIILYPSAFISKVIGPRFTSLIGCIIMSSGIALTYFTCNSTFAVFIVTYGILFGGGIAFAYITVLTTAMKWFPAHRGIANGCVVAGFGLGSSVFNQMQTAFINPKNLPTNSDGYFTDSTVLNKVPDVFLLMAGVYFAMQLIGCALITRSANEINQEDEAGSENHLSPKQVLRRKEFYILFATMFLNSMVVTFFNAMYKAFGEQFIYDDHYLTMVGSVGSVLNAFSRIIWGAMGNWTSYRVCMMSMTAAVSALMFSMPATALVGGKAMYTVWALALNAMMSGTYALLPTNISRIWGNKYLQYNYGMICFQGIFSSVLTAGLTQILVDDLGYDPMLLLLGALSSVSMVITYFFNENILSVTDATVNTTNEDINGVTMTTIT